MQIPSSPSLRRCASPLLVPILGNAGTLLQYDFNAVSPWPVTAGKPGSPGVQADTFTASGGLLLTVIKGEREGWTSSIRSRPLALKNPDNNLGKLTLAFDLLATRAPAVRVVIESLNGKQERTGALETTIHPWAADFYQRHALDLSTFKQSGSGTFDPTAPFITMSYEISNAIGWLAATRDEIRLDNVHLATPACDVSPQGSDTADGRTEATAYATPQKMADAAQPGNIIVARPNGPIDSWYGKKMDVSAGIFRANNLYLGGVNPNIEGVNDLKSNPLFVKATADFRPQPASPARQAGRWETFSPPLDFDGKPRPNQSSPSIGAYE